jgi:hypothetical protein
MNNPEKLWGLDTQDTGQRQTKQNTQHGKLQRWATVESWTSLYV